MKTSETTTKPISELQFGELNGNRPWFPKPGTDEMVVIISEDLLESYKAAYGHFDVEITVDQYGHESYSVPAFQASIDAYCARKAQTLKAWRTTE